MNRNIGLVIHATLFVVWIALLVPTVLWWRESIFWIGFMSIYALIATHATGIEAALAKKAAEK